jgi:MFS transporter, OPA family, glycerol-3-phosphate transporter
VNKSLLLFALFFCYGSFYLCRANLDAAGPLLIKYEGLTKTSFGELSTIATFTYAVGKFVMGASGDVLGGRRMLAVAIGGSVVCTFAFGMQHAFVLLVAFAAANKFFQSGGWSGLVHVVSRRFEPARHGAIMGVLSTSYELGNVVALTLSGLVAHWGWRTLFVVNPLLFAAVGGGALLVLRGGEKQRERVAKAAGEEEPKLPLSVILPQLASHGAFWVALAMSALLTFLRISFLTWTPTYLSELSRAVGHEDISADIVKSAIFPASGVVAALSVGAISDRLGRGRRAPIMAASLAVVVVLLIVLGHAGIKDATTAAFLIGGVGLFLLGPYSLLAGAVALDIAGKRGTATATGIIDGAGYLAGALSGYVLGAVADHAGWSAVFDLVTAAALLATIVSGAWAWATVARKRAPEVG